MKKLDIAAFLFLGIIVGLIISTHFTKRQVYCIFQSWDRPEEYCSSKYMQPGDKLKLNLKGTHKEFYKNCKAIYLQGVAVKTDNVVWVLLSGCDFQTGKYAFMEDPTTETFSLRDVEKIQ